MNGVKQAATTSQFVFDPASVDLGDGGLVTVECRVGDNLWKDDAAVVQSWTVSVGSRLWVSPDGSADPDGSEARPYATLDQAMEMARSGDVIYLKPGVYDVEWLRGGVQLQATGSREETVLRGYWIEGSETDEGCGDGFGRPVVRGVSVLADGVWGVQFEDCRLDGGSSAISDEEGSVSSCMLSNCLVTGFGGGVRDSVLEFCTVAGNPVRWTAISACDLWDCIVADNYRPDGTLANVADPWEEGDDWDDDEYDHDEIYVRTCLIPLQPGEGNIAEDPLFVDGHWGDFRLRKGSPAREMGARFLAQDVEGLVLSARIVGNGDVQPHTAVVPEGGTATFTASGRRPLVAFEVDGRQVASSGQVLTLRNVTADAVVTAVFTNYTFYVDRERGDDNNDGLSEKRPKATIQAALDEALDGDRIVVKRGRYAPIVGKGRHVLVEAVDGVEATVIDGTLGEGTCAYLGMSPREPGDPAPYADWFGTNTVLRGFTLTGGHDWRGGGALGGTLENCVVSNNVAWLLGGGVYASFCRRCLIVGNAVAHDGTQAADMWGVVRGGGACQATLVDCTVSRNELTSSDETVWLEGLGIAECRAIGTIVYGNGQPEVYDGSLSNCVTDGDADPLFNDPDHGDFHLRPDSPYVVDGRATVGCYEWPAGSSPDGPDADPVFEPSSPYYPEFCAWTVANGLARASETNDAARMRAVALTVGVKDAPQWEDFVAGTDPYDPESRLTARIETQENYVRISWTPNLNAGAVRRIYKVLGRTSLETGDWEPVQPWHRFFKVTVAVPTGAAGETSAVSGAGFVP